MNDDVLKKKITRRSRKQSGEKKLASASQHLLFIYLLEDGFQCSIRK